MRKGVKETIEKDYIVKLQEYKSKILQLEKDRDLLELRIKDESRRNYELKLEEYKQQILEYKSQLYTLKDTMKVEYETKINYYKLQLDSIKELTENRIKENYTTIINTLNEQIENLKLQNTSYVSQYN